ncbi:hypothetical protein Val02_45940 [Virgisporangium aliadipatigenens]|uniref:Methyltransferase domain-containing protein n=1 Tax=Virgisporangium aliadipatigenens TaxID=741659 RepID=A0A8J3YQ08_9ACTN|nr:class I SAM-dependent methyltransferase [Virgisporangium aliadipatigenens]GIJ47708.1 hypothetical protein Val02_45940 [Virgisporangium aliadipatigenens]
MLADEVLAYYRQLGETDRLRVRASGRLEFLRTWDLLGRLLPAPPARVLDVGGATGIYAGPLAAAGYRPHVVDPVPEHVDAAAALPGVTAALGDARALPEPDGSADAVLLLGPLYHLLERADRGTAWREAARVVRPGGVVLAATISRFASAFDGFARDFYAEPGYAAVVDGALRTGAHRPVANAWFTTAYFHHPDEPPAEAAEAGLEPAGRYAIEGPGWHLPRLEAILDDPRRRGQLMDFLRRVESEPSLLGATSHLLTAARRRS